jgi:8-oxo-dGTP pyrophosphatase MutT (NUDIX family)
MVELDLDPSREAIAPRDAATILVVRESSAGLEVFCVERHPKSGFLGGAVVFPGGKVDAADASADWAEVVRADVVSAGGGADERVFKIAACREALEESAILPGVSAVSHAELLELRARLARKETSVIAFLRGRALRLDLATLLPFARWVTPVAESRRYDTRFYLTRLPEGQEGAHDDRETTSSFWARPADVLARWEEGRVALAPPTHRTLEVLAGAAAWDAAVALSAHACLDPICPVVVMQEGTVALALPGDPEHEVRESRVPGRSRYVLRGDRFLPEDAPSPRSPG